MNKSCLIRLAKDIEAKHGKAARDRIFGDINDRGGDSATVARWFENFTSGMDELDDKEFLTALMVKHCPCGGDASKDGEIIKGFYDKSKSLEEFVSLLDEWQHKRWKGREDTTELRGNVLYMTKKPVKSSKAGKCGKGCHCVLARHTDNYVSDIFCYCCTIGHTGKPFQVAFGEDIKLEFIDSLIIGGKGCTMAIYLPLKV